MVFFIVGIAEASSIFEYEIHIQAETSLAIGPIEVQGRVVNTGTVSIDLTSQWGALGGIPGSIGSTLTELSHVHDQLMGLTLDPNNSLDFIWLSGTIEENVSAYAGGFLSGSLGFIPLGSDWHWTSGGFIPELIVSSEWVNGAADTSLPFNKVVINLDSAGDYIEVTPIPISSAIWLFGSGLIGIAGIRKKVNM